MADSELAARKAICEIVPACGQVCASKAITFGDIRDTKSVVSEKRRNSRNYQMLTELNLRARTTYLARVRNPNPQFGEKKGG
jgi:molybdopterin-containing oxidoreductase family iron-sulfur binding subunit